MTKLHTIDPETATGKTLSLLDSVQSALGITPNMMRVMANSPAVLEGYLLFNKALAGGALKGEVREIVALAVAEANGCDYCLAAHSALGAQAGLPEAVITDARRFKSGEAHIQTLLDFTRDVLINRGVAEIGSIDKLRTAGFTDGEIAEILANIALSIFTNYFNSAVGTEVDFPAVPPLSSIATV